MSKIGVALNAIVMHLNFYVFLGIGFGDRQLRFGENGLLCITEDIKIVL